ncbi:DUF4189 domain-containing protein [Stenotrophomonas sp. PD6]|uniref:DUF4189 domain-containing protein n=1 Tax=Stenotrophomonas sp. PD6 TaxID=3368612 RepID=UPI003B9EE036
MKLLVAILLGLSSFSAFAEGACPPGQYPIGGQGVQGCAPIPQGGASAPASPKPTGKWETRWGAVAEDYSASERGVVTATGVAESRKSKRDAVAVAIDQCTKAGGQKCKVVIAYHNQCVAMADPKPRSQGGLGGKSVTYGAETLELAKSEAIKRCSPDGSGQCSISYSACSMSEFKAF